MFVEGRREEVSLCLGLLMTLEVGRGTGGNFMFKFNNDFGRGEGGGGSAKFTSKLNFDF